jgi:hypothetical protein
MSDVIKLPDDKAMPMPMPMAPPKAQIVITLEPDGNISIQSNIANLYAAVGILTSAINGMLQQARQPQSRIVVP